MVKFILTVKSLIIKSLWLSIIEYD
jgi:hypothetical protein